MKLASTLVAAAIKSAPFPCAEGSVVIVRSQQRVLDPANAAVTYVRWLNANQTTLATTTVAFMPGNTVTYLESVAKPVRAPTGTAFAQVIIAKDEPLAYAVWADAVQVTVCR